MPGQRGLTIAASAAAGLAGRHVAGRNKAGKQTAAELDTRLADLGEVERVSILAVVERHTDMPGLHGEPGLSSLIKADDLTIVFDTGLGTGCDRTALKSNSGTLGVALDDLRCVAISHSHAAHAGGAKFVSRPTLRFGREQAVGRALTTFVPTEMTHPQAGIFACPGLCPDRLAAAGLVDPRHRQKH